MTYFNSKTRFSFRNFIDIYNQESTSDGTGFRVINDDGSQNLGLEELQGTKTIGGDAIAVIPTISYVQHIFGGQSSSIPKLLFTTTGWQDITYSGAFNRTENVNMFALSGIEGGTTTTNSTEVTLTLSNNSNFSSPTYQETISVDLTNYSSQSTFLGENPYDVPGNSHAFFVNNNFIVYFPEVTAKYYRINIPQMKVPGFSDGVSLGGIYLSRYWEGDSYLEDPQINLVRDNQFESKILQKTLFSRLKIPVEFNFLTSESYQEFIDQYTRSKMGLCFIDMFFNENNVKANRATTFGKIIGDIKTSQSNPLTKTIQFVFEEARGYPY